MLRLSLSCSVWRSSKNDFYRLAASRWDLDPRIICGTSAEREREGRKVASVEKILDNDEEGAGLLHNSTKRSPWMEGAQTLEDVFDDAQPLNRVEVKKQSGRSIWQEETPEQGMDDKPWKERALQELKEAFSSMSLRWPVVADVNTPLPCLHIWPRSLRKYVRLKLSGMQQTVCQSFSSTLRPSSSWMPATCSCARHGDRPLETTTTRTSGIDRTTSQGPIWWGRQSSTNFEKASDKCRSDTCQDEHKLRNTGQTGRATRKLPWRKCTGHLLAPARQIRVWSKRPSACFINCWRRERTTWIECHSHKGLCTEIKQNTQRCSRTVIWKWILVLAPRNRSKNLYIKCQQKRHCRDLQPGYRSKLSRMILGSSSSCRYPSINLENGQDSKFSDVHRTWIRWFKRRQAFHWFEIQPLGYSNYLQARIKTIRPCGFYWLTLSRTAERSCFWCLQLLNRVWWQLDISQTYSILGRTDYSFFDDSVTRLKNELAENNPNVISSYVPFSDDDTERPSGVCSLETFLLQDMDVNDTVIIIAETWHTQRWSERKIDSTLYKGDLVFFCNCPPTQGNLRLCAHERTPGVPQNVDDLETIKFADLLGTIAEDQH